MFLIFSIRLKPIPGVRLLEGRVTLLVRTGSLMEFARVRANAH
jgi:hypothetical protein